MARIARVVAPDIPHHITQGGNRRQETFFQEEGYEAYLQIMAEWCKRCGVDVWAYDGQLRAERGSATDLTR
jgi:putative transposase